MANTEFSKWLEKQFLQWQVNKGGRGTVTGFAQWLGVSRNTLNNWMLRGEKPTADNVKLLSEKLGLEVYDAVDLPRPDPYLEIVIRRWGGLSDTAKQNIIREVEESPYNAEIVDHPKLTKGRRSAKKS